MVRHIGCYQIGDWQFDVDTMVLCIDSEYVHPVVTSCHYTRKAHSLRLPFKTADVLALLAEYKGKVVPLSTMAERVWQGDEKVARKGIVNTISKLRRILVQGQFSQYIVNEPKKGYRLCVSVENIESICQPTPTPPEPCFAQVLGWTAPEKRKRRSKNNTEPIESLSQSLENSSKTTDVQAIGDPTNEQSITRVLLLTKIVNKLSNKINQLRVHQSQQLTPTQFQGDNNNINHFSWRSALFVSLLAAISVSI